MIYVFTWSRTLNNFRFLLSNMSNLHGRPITWIKKFHRFGGGYCLLPTFYTRISIYFANAIVSSLLDGWPINAWQEIFIHVASPSLTGRAEVPYDKYWHIYAFYCLFLLFILCVALRRCWKLNFKEVSVTPIFLRQQIRIYDSICSTVFQLYLYSNKISLQTDCIYIWPWDLGLKGRSHNFRLNCLTLYK